MSEHDSIIHFARFLNEGGVPWETIHHQVSASRWLFEHPHLAAVAGANKWKWRVDLALLGTDEFLAAHLPAPEPDFQFDACLEFAYLTDYWPQDGAHPWGAPGKGLSTLCRAVNKTPHDTGGGPAPPPVVTVGRD